MLAPARADGHRVSDAGHRWKFFLHWLRNPLRAAAVAPSGPGLTEAMLAELPPGTRRVIELGGGTGVFTDRLLDTAHIAPRDLLVLELEPSMHAHLESRFPGVCIVHGDARNLVELATASGYLHVGPADAVISGLGLLTMDRSLQQEIVSAAFDCLRSGGAFIQFTYGPTPPVDDAVRAHLGLHVERRGFVLRNVPPANVFVYRRVSATG